MKYENTKEIKTNHNTSGYYWCNYAGKIVLAKIVNEVELQLLSNSSIYVEDDSWEEIERGGWRTKNVLVNEVEFFNFKIK